MVVAGCCVGHDGGGVGIPPRGRNSRRFVMLGPIVFFFHFKFFQRFLGFFFSMVSAIIEVKVVLLSYVVFSFHRFFSGLFLIILLYLDDGDYFEESTVDLFPPHGSSS